MKRTNNHDTGVSLPKSRVGRALLPPLIGIVLAMAGLYAGFAHRHTDFDSFSGFRADNTVRPAVVEGRPVHCIGLKQTAVCLEPANDSDFPLRFLWLGASQLHSIHDCRPGDQVAPAYLTRLLRPHGVDLLTFSAPNGNLQELYIMFEAVRSKIAINGVIIGAVFDDLKEPGIRPEYLQALGDPAVAAALGETEAGRRILAASSEHADQGAGVGYDKSEDSIQQQVEQALVAFLGTFRLWSLRTEAQGWTKIGLRYLRDAVLFITDSQRAEAMTPAIRLIPDNLYRDNMQALEALLESARSSGIKVMVYLAPRPLRAFFPYDMDSYLAFQQEVARLAERYQAQYVNLEDSIPDNGWNQGVVLSGRVLDRDIFHCEGPGHLAFAKAVYQALGQVGMLPPGGEE